MNHWIACTGLLAAGSLPLTLGSADSRTTWVDLDGDGHEDLVSVARGRLRVLFADGAGRFVAPSDGSALTGLLGVGALTIADVDGDGGPELFLSMQRGPHALLAFDGVTFHDRAAAAGLADLGPIDDADWRDVDADGDLDLVATSAEGPRLYENDGLGVFAEASLPAGAVAGAHAGVVTQPGVVASPDGTGAGASEAANDRSTNERTRAGGRETARRSVGVRTAQEAPDPSSSSVVTGSSTFGSSAQQVGAMNLFACANSVRDQANGQCVQASSEPLDGFLYPLSRDFFVSDFFGWIGMGTFDPQADLHIDGGALTQIRLSGDDIFGTPETAIQFGLDEDFDEGMTLRSDDGGLQIHSQRLVGPGGATSLEFGPHLFVSRVATTKVGIGEDNPQTTLHVGGDTTLAGETALEDVMRLKRDDGTEMATFYPEFLPGFGSTLILKDENGLEGIRLDGQLGTGAFLRMNKDDSSVGVSIDADSGGAPIMAFYKADGSVGITIDANQSGDARITTEVLEITGGADLVESFDTGERACEPGTVMVIDSERPGELAPSRAPYDARLAGIVSGAGGIQPGLRLGQEGVASGSTPIALTGRVYVRTTDENGSIRPGDMLTSSSTEGCAMRATDRERSFGAILGKAMSTPHPETGLVLVLVNLQ